MSPVAPPGVRRNATVRPSGENSGQVSPKYPSGGEVSWRFSPVSVDNRNMLSGFSGAGLSTIASTLPSGDQDKVWFAP